MRGAAPWGSWRSRAFNGALDERVGDMALSGARRDALDAQRIHLAAAATIRD